MTLISPGDCILQCGTWLWNRDNKFTKWQHPAMWYVVLGWRTIEFARWKHPAMWHVAVKSWHWIRQVATPCSVANGCGMTCHGIRPNVRHIGILHLLPISTNHRTRHVMLHQSPKFYPNRTTLGTSCRFLRWRTSAILDFWDPIMGYLKSPITTY